MDVWQYIAMEKLEIPSIYFAHEREVVNREGMLLANSDFISLPEGEEFTSRRWCVFVPLAMPAVPVLWNRRQLA